MSPYDWSYMQIPKKQTLTQRMIKLTERVTKLENINQPYTAMRSMEEYWIDEFVDFQSDTKKRLVYLEKQFIKHTEGQYLHGGTDKPINPQEDVEKRLKTYLTNNLGLNNNLEYIAKSILAIVKGE